jgi:hypothetical protein
MRYLSRIVLVAVLCTIGWVACDKAVDPGSTGVDAPLHDAFEAPHNRSLHALGDPVRGSEYWRRASWVGEYHTAMMVEAMSAHGEWVNTTAAHQCALVTGLLVKYVAIMQAEHRMRLGATPRSFVEQIVDQHPRCSRPIRLVSYGARARFVSLAIATDGDPVSGAFEPYLYQIGSAVNSGSTPSAIGQGVNTVLNQAVAAGIPGADLDLVFAAASLALESVDYWYEYEQTVGWGGGGGGGPDPTMPADPVSTLSLAAGRSWRGAAAADYVGCTATAVGVWAAVAGPIGWKVLAGSCGIGGAAASVLYAM